MESSPDDASLLRRTEQQLRESQEHTRLIVQASLDALITIDHEDRITEFNPAAEQVFGWRREEVIGRGLAQIIPPAMRESHRAGLARHRDPHQAPRPRVQLELTALRRDGAEFPIELTVTRMDGDGQPKFIAFIRDLTEVRRTRHEAQRHAVRLSAIVEAQRELALSDAGEEQLTAHIAEMARKLLAADGAAFLVLRDDHLQVRSASGISESYRGARLALDSSLSGLAVRRNQTVRCDDRAADERVDVRARADVRWSSLMAAVLRIGAAGAGVISVVSRQPYYFGPEDESALELLAETLGTVLQRRRHAEQLKASELQYRSLFVEQPLLLLVYDPHTLRMLAVNAAARAHYGYTEAEFLQLTIEELRPEPDREAWRKVVFASPLEGKREHSGRHCKKNGEVFFVRTFSNEILFQGVPARVVLAMDVTEQLRAAEELRRSEARFRALTELSADWFWEQDEELRFTDISARDKTPGSPALRSSALGKKRWEISGVDTDDWEAHRAQLERREPFRDVEFRLRSHRGGLLYVQVSGAPVFDSEGRFTGYRGVSRDVTGHKQAQDEIASLNAELEERVRMRTAQLEAANADLEAFSYSIAHDLRSPLTSIDGFTHLLETSCGAELGAQGIHYLRRIRAGVASMSELTDAMLSLAQLSGMSIQSTEVDLAALARSALADLREREPGRPVTTEIPEHLWVRGDARLLAQVMANLLGNAWKFSGRKPQTWIRVGCEQVEGENVYVVADRGAGFDAAHASGLFRAFQRLHGISEFEGTGVGLALVHRILLQHGGRIWAAAQPGEGASFYFTLGTPGPG
ncbi:MAG: PAS domain S-box protein [Ramlibacter sp.]|nr:PAS domain S-box protein [Ramlibacter sp.]